VRVKGAELLANGAKNATVNSPDTANISPRYPHSAIAVHRFSDAGSALREALETYRGTCSLVAWHRPVCGLRHRQGDEMTVICSLLLLLLKPLQFACLYQRLFSVQWRGDKNAVCQRWEMLS
jgi:hypothetical protein